MQEAIRSRERFNRHAARAVGLRGQNPYVTAAQQRGARSQADIMALPVNTEQYAPLQVTDTTDPNFGKFYFLPDYSTPGGSDILR